MSSLGSYLIPRNPKLIRIHQKYITWLIRNNVGKKWFSSIQEFLRTWDRSNDWWCPWPNAGITNKPFRCRNLVYLTLSWMLNHFWLKTIFIGSIRIINSLTPITDEFCPPILRLKTAFLFRIKKARFFTNLTSLGTYNSCVIGETRKFSNGSSNILIGCQKSHSISFTPVPKVRCN